MPNKKVKVIYIHHGAGIGGAPISLANLIKSLDPSLVEFKIACIVQSPIVKYFEENGFDVDVINGSSNYFIHNESGTRSWFHFLKYFFIYFQWHKTANVEATKYLRNIDADIVHLNSHVLTSWAKAAKLLNFKVILHNREAISRGIFGIRYSILKSLISKYCDVVINISADNKRRLGIEINSVVIYNSVPIPEKFKPSMDARDGRHVKVLYLGGASSMKGYKILVRSLKYLHKNIDVIFAGGYGSIGNEMTLKDKIKRWIKLSLYRSEYKVLLEMYQSERAIVVGMIPNPLEFINECDILVTPFTIQHFSRPAIEAFAYGKPVIGSNVEGMDEIIDHGVNGLLVNKNDVNALAAAINYLSLNEEIAREMGIAGRQKAIKLFSPEVNGKLVQNIYQDLMNGY